MRSKSTKARVFERVYIIYNNLPNTGGTREARGGGYREGRREQAEAGPSRSGTERGQAREPGEEIPTGTPPPSII